MNSKTPESHKLAQHWLPDLCRTEALFWVTLLSVVLAIILELLIRGANFSLVGFGQRALLILWMVLIGCLLACLIRRISVDWALWQVVLAVMAGIQLAGLLGAWGQSLVTGAPLLDTIVPSQLLSALIGSVSLRFFYLQYQERQRAERLKQAEFELLQARIQPHFLFNTLNSIASLIVTKPEQAETAVLDLADLMRSSLRAGQKLIPLSEEVDLCEKYLKIESLRMGDRLRWNFVIAPEARAVKIPSLSLQPIVENAVLHGVSKITQGGTINLEVSMEPGSLQGVPRLCLKIQNPVPDEPARQGNKFALKNVVERLQICAVGPVKFESGQRDGIYTLQVSMVPNES